MNIFCRLIIFLHVGMGVLCAMHLPQKKMQSKKFELRALHQLTLKERALIALMDKYGIECMRVLKAPVDLINFNNFYVESCCHAIKEYAKISPQLRIRKDQPASAPLNLMIQHAYEKKRFDILRIIMERYYATQEWPALCLLAYGGYTKSCEILLDLNYVNVNCVDHMLRTPLMNAAKNGKATLVELLLKRKDVNLMHQDRCKKDACQLARENKHSASVVLLEEALHNKKR